MTGRKIADFEKQQKKEEDFLNRRGGGTEIPPINEPELSGLIEDFSSISNDNGWGGLLVEELGDQRDADHLGQAFRQCKSMGISY
jgi:hypothetical protein